MFRHSTFNYQVLVYDSWDPYVSISHITLEVTVIRPTRCSLVGFLDMFLWIQKSNREQDLLKLV
jgi:hypothetical protein